VSGATGGLGGLIFSAGFGIQMSSSDERKNVNSGQWTVVGGQ
jgi:hypothetical protein